MLPGVEGSRVWAHLLTITLVSFKVSKEFLLSKSLSTCFGSLTPFLGEGFPRESPDVIPAASLPQALCLDPTGHCRLLGGLT